MQSLIDYLDVDGNLHDTRREKGTRAVQGIAD